MIPIYLILILYDIIYILISNPNLYNFIDQKHRFMSGSAEIILNSCSKLTVQR